MATKTLEIDAQEAVFLALLSDMDMDTRDAVRTLLRKLVTVNLAHGSAGGAL
jgi:hypothetical protein